MKIRIIDGNFAVCIVKDFSKVPYMDEFFFLARTDEEYSMVCQQESVPDNAEQVEKGWKAFRVEGILDFSLTGILAELSALMAEHDIGIFAVSTYRTDYILVKEGKLDQAICVLKKAGHEISI